MPKPLYIRVSAFLRKNPRVTENRFGEEAAGAHTFVKKLRTGAAFKQETIDRVHKWLDEHGG